MYAFVVLHLEDATIIGLAYGQSGLVFRVPGDRLAEARRQGGRLSEELGPGWVSFEPWTDAESLEESRRRLARWCRIAAGQPHDGPSA